MRAISIITLCFIFSMTLLSTQTIDAREDNRRAESHTPGCNTKACDKRMAKKAHKKTIHRWKKIIKPYRGWLESTGNCETRGMTRRAAYRANTGNGFYGRYQFLPSTWRSVGGSGLPHQASPLEQDYRAVKLRITGGRGHWPVCG